MFLELVLSNLQVHIKAFTWLHISQAIWSYKGDVSENLRLL